MLGQLLVLVVVLLPQQLLLQLVRADPREEFQPEFAAQVDHVLKVQLDLLHYPLGVRLQLPELRAYHIIIHVLSTTSLFSPRDFFTLLTLGLRCLDDVRVDLSCLKRNRYLVLLRVIRMHLGYSVGILRFSGCFELWLSHTSNLLLIVKYL